MNRVYINHKNYISRGTNMTREDIIQNIKDCGQSLIDNAENIANNYKYMNGLTITCYVAECGEPPYISIDTDFTPENTIERCKCDKI